MWLATSFWLFEIRIVTENGRKCSQQCGWWPEIALKHITPCCGSKVHTKSSFLPIHKNHKTLTDPIFFVQYTTNHDKTTKRKHKIQRCLGSCCFCTKKKQFMIYSKEKFCESFHPFLHKFRKITKITEIYSNMPWAGTP